MMKAQGGKYFKHKQVLPIPMHLRKITSTLCYLGSDKEDYLDVITGIFQVFSINVNRLRDLGDTLSFLTPLVATVRRLRRVFWKILIK